MIDRPIWWSFGPVAEKYIRKGLLRYSTALETGSGVGALIWKGLAALQRGAELEAADLLGQAAERAQDSQEQADALCARALARVRLGEVEAALADLNQAAVVRPDDDKVYFGRGIVQGMLKQYGEAIADFDRALDRNPDLHEIYFQRGVARHLLGDLRAAVGEYDRAIAGKTLNLARALALRGLAKAHLEDYRGSLADFNRALQLAPDEAGFYYGRGVVKGLVRNHQGARGDFNRAIELDPADAEAYNKRGIACLILGDRQAGLADLQKAAELGYSEAFQLIDKIAADKD